MQTGLPEKLPNSAGGTKGCAFWTFLSVLLEATRPRTLLEVGCGRSSTFFADYAYAHKATYVGIESDVRWFNKVDLDIDLLGFNTRHLTHVPLAADGSWYDLDAFRAATSNPGQFDFAFIDGPNEKCFFPDEAAIAQFFSAQAVSPSTRWSKRWR